MHPLAKKIASLQQRLIWRRRAAASCRVAAAILGATLLLGLADYLVRFRDPGLRVMATSALAAAAAWAAHRWWYLPSRRRIGPLMVARRVETRFPQLRDALASALEFLGQSEDDRRAGSAQLRRLVVAEAATAAEGLPLDEVIERRPLRRAAGWLAAALFCVAVFLVLDAGAVGTALARLAAPLGSVEWPRQHRLAFREVPERLAAGQPFEVELINTAGPLPDEVRIEYRTSRNGSRDFSSELLTRTGDRMIARRENVRRSFEFRAVGGDDNTMEWHHVEVVEPPQLESLQITTHPPEYTALPAAPAERHLQVLAGTGVELKGTVGKRIVDARILLDDVEPVVATIQADASGNEGRAFHIPPSRWTATKSGEYRLELTNSEGTPVIVGQWNLRVEPDSPPSVSWRRPQDDLYVLPRALVPIELVVKDNLAVQSVELNYERSDRSEAELERQPHEPAIDLYRGPPQPVAPGNVEAATGESRVIEHTWDLAPLDLPAGAEITMQAEAADYRPGVGRTVAPRRIRLITPEELEAHLADRLTQIVRQLERALAAQRATREEVRRLEVQRDEADLQAADRRALQSAELSQQRVRRMLGDPVDGVPALLESLRSMIEMNRVGGGEMQSALDRLAQELDRLAAGPLEAAQRELTAARKTLEALPKNGDATVLQSIATAGVSQDEVIAALERLITDLSGKADYRRFARLLAELRRDQLAHQQTAQTEIGLKTLPLRLNELSRAQRAALDQAAASQSALAARFERIERGMDQMARELADEESEAAGTLADAVALARRLAIRPGMQQTAQDYRENRVGQALDRETQIASHLEQVLAVLRKQEERRPEQLDAKLREAEQRLGELRDELARLRQQVARAEQQAAEAADQPQLGQLHQKQNTVRGEMEQLARQLERLQAADAGQSVQRAAKRLDNRDSNERRPSPSPDMQQAERDLDEAARQLAARRQLAEDDLALAFVRRFQAELGRMVERQQRVIETTAELDSGEAPAAELPAAAREERDVAVAQLAEEERRLAAKAREHSELLFGLGAVRVSLEEAERRLITAAELLDQRQAGPSVQQAERNALLQLEGMMQAFAQTADEAGQNQQPAAGAAPGGEQPPRRPTFELLEVKMLRMLQVDLNERTADYRQRLAGLDGPPDARQQAELAREARELAAQQGRLAELVQDMLARDNEE